jgi:hypothetical protein
MRSDPAHIGGFFSPANGSKNFNFFSNLLDRGLIGKA